MNATSGTGRVLRRVVAEGTLVLTAPAHMGGEDPTGVSDASIARDHRGRPILYGTTLAGLLRSVVAERLYGPRWSGKADHRLTLLFGHESGSDGHGQSALVVDDAVAPIGPTELRDGVAIDPAAGVAESGLKFDMELLPVGTRFGIRLELSVRDGAASDQAEALFAGLVTCMELLEDEDGVAIGARTRKGFGRCTVPGAGQNDEPGGWTVTDLDLTSRTGTLSWLRADHPSFESNGRSDAWPRAEPRRYGNAEAFAAELRQSGGFQGLKSHAPRNERFEFVIDAGVLSSLIVRSAGHAPEDADETHLSRRTVSAAGDGATTEPVAPGTTLGGVIRARALRIANTIAVDQARKSKTSPDDPLQRASRLVTWTFGARGRTSKPSAGRVLVDESVITGGRILRHTRVSIDRWTGGALEHLLFEEDAQFKGTVRIRWRLPLPRRTDGTAAPNGKSMVPEQRTSQQTSAPVPDIGHAAVGLLLCVLKDLATADLPVGGEGGIGRGRLLGRQIEITRRSGHGAPNIWRMTPDPKHRRLRFEGDQAELEKLDELYVRALGTFING